MYSKKYAEVANAAEIKVSFLKNNPIGFFLSSMFAGVFVGFGILLAFTVGGYLTGQPYQKFFMGIPFGIALSLVVMAGSELFTGNNFVVGAGIMNKTISLSEAVKVWIICYLGNWIGSVLLAVAFVGGGLATGVVGEFIANSSAVKMSIPFVPLLLRGILCNILVCLAVWCGFKLESESGKLIMISWCLFAFLVIGFEHSIANMTILTISLLAPMEAAVSLGGYFYNILIVSFGNMLGGVFCVALPYYLISKK